MPILFAISVLALVALLWASISAARHIRRARRRRRRSLGQEATASFPGRIGLQVATAPASKEVAFQEMTPYREAVTSRTWPSAAFSEELRFAPPAPRVTMVVPEPPYVPSPAYVPRLTYAQVSPFVSVEAKPLAVQTVSEIPAPSQIENIPAHAVPVAPTVAQAEPAPVPAPAAVFNEPSVPKKPSTALRPSASRLSLIASSGKMERPDWAYFNKDMGDLTDPYESPRMKARVASGSSRR